MELNGATLNTELCWFDESIEVFIPLQEKEVCWRMSTAKPNVEGDKITIRTTLDVELYLIASEEKVIGNIKTSLITTFFLSSEECIVSQNTSLRLSMFLIEYTKMVYAENQFGKLNYSKTFLSISPEDVWEKILSNNS